MMIRIFYALVPEAKILEILERIMPKFRYVALKIC